jgi:tetratricopeptide (TPR) repeat protein
MKTIDEAKTLMEHGWKARENLEFDQAEKLLAEAKQIFEENGDWYNVTECLNHLAYSYKLRAVHNNLQGLELAKQAEALAIKHSTKKTSVLRALLSLANSSGLFEQARMYCTEALALQGKPAPKADLMVHLALIEMRTGNLTKALQTVNEAEQLLLDNFETERDPHRSIWLTNVYGTKAVILYNQNELDQAKNYLAKALEIATDKDLKTRVKTLKELEYFIH